MGIDTDTLKGLEVQLAEAEIQRIHDAMIVRIAELELELAQVKQLNIRLNAENARLRANHAWLDCHIRSLTATIEANNAKLEALHWEVR
jgi:hypothetical protein